MHMHVHMLSGLTRAVGGPTCVEQRACRGALARAHEVAAAPRRAAECSLLGSGVRCAQEAGRAHLAPS